MPDRFGLLNQAAAEALPALTINRSALQSTALLSAARVAGGNSVAADDPRQC